MARLVREEEEASLYLGNPGLSKEKHARVLQHPGLMPVLIRYYPLCKRVQPILINSCQRAQIQTLGMVGLELLR